jgi:hypothetical protein
MAEDGLGVVNRVAFGAQPDFASVDRLSAAVLQRRDRTQTHSIARLMLRVAVHEHHNAVAASHGPSGSVIPSLQRQPSTSKLALLLRGHLAAGDEGGPLQRHTRDLKMRVRRDSATGRPEVDDADGGGGGGGADAASVSWSAAPRRGSQAALALQQQDQEAAEAAEADAGLDALNGLLSLPLPPRDATGTAGTTAEARVDQGGGSGGGASGGARASAVPPSEPAPFLRGATDHMSPTEVAAAVANLPLIPVHVRAVRQRLAGTVSQRLETPVGEPVPPPPPPAAAAATNAGPRSPMNSSSSSSLLAGIRRAAGVHLQPLSGGLASSAQRQQQPAKPLKLLPTHKAVVKKLGGAKVTLSQLRGHFTFPHNLAAATAVGATAAHTIAPSEGHLYRIKIDSGPFATVAAAAAAAAEEAGAVGGGGGATGRTAQETSRLSLIIAASAREAGGGGVGGNSDVGGASGGRQAGLGGGSGGSGGVASATDAASRRRAEDVSRVVRLGRQRRQAAQAALLQRMRVDPTADEDSDAEGAAQAKEEAAQAAARRRQQQQQQRQGGDGQQQHVAGAGQGATGARRRGSAAAAAATSTGQKGASHDAAAASPPPLVVPPVAGGAAHPKGAAAAAAARSASTASLPSAAAAATAAAAAAANASTHYVDAVFGATAGGAEEALSALWVQAYAEVLASPLPPPPFTQSTAPAALASSSKGSDPSSLHRRCQQQWQRLETGILALQADFADKLPIAALWRVPLEVIPRGATTTAVSPGGGKKQRRRQQASPSGSESPEQDTSRLRPSSSSPLVSPPRSPTATPVATSATARAGRASVAAPVLPLASSPNAARSRLDQVLAAALGGGGGVPPPPIRVPAAYPGSSPQRRAQTAGAAVNAASPPRSVQPTASAAAAASGKGGRRSSVAVAEEKMSSAVAALQQALTLLRSRTLTRIIAALSRLIYWRVLRPAYAHGQALVAAEAESERARQQQLLQSFGSAAGVTMSPAIVLADSAASVAAAANAAEAGEGSETVAAASDVTAALDLAAIVQDWARVDVALASKGEMALSHTRPLLLLAVRATAEAFLRSRYPRHALFEVGVSRFARVHKPPPALNALSASLRETLNLRRQQQQHVGGTGSEAPRTGSAGSQRRRRRRSSAVSAVGGGSSSTFELSPLVRWLCEDSRPLHAHVDALVAALLDPGRFGSHIAVLEVRMRGG